MHHVTLVLVSTLVLFCTIPTLYRLLNLNVDMASAKSLIPLLMATWASASTSNNTKAVDTSWHPPKKSWVNDLDQVMNSTGTHGFVFSGSQLPAGVPYGTYNWCNMPHVRREEYKKAGDGFELIYVEVYVYP